MISVHTVPVLPSCSAYWEETAVLLSRMVVPSTGRWMLACKRPPPALLDVYQTVPVNPDVPVRLALRFVMTGGGVPLLEWFLPPSANADVFMHSMMADAITEKPTFDKSFIRITIKIDKHVRDSCTDGSIQAHPNRKQYICHLQQNHYSVFNITRYLMGQDIWFKKF